MESVVGAEEAVATPPLLVRRLRQAIGALLLVAVAFMQSGTNMVADTKLDLVVAPGRFLARSLQAWDPQAAFGQLQNQAYGYLFPMGPFFWLGEQGGLPAWLIQRTWWCLVLLVAYAGMLRLGALWGIGTSTTRIVGALAYALSAHLLAALGSISIEIWPMAVLPWILIPLVRVESGVAPRRAALLSALAVVCLGGVNAAANLAVLVVPFVYLLTLPRSPGRTKLRRWWVLGVALACTWWALPLLVLGRYSYPFLDQIETASTTASVGSLLNNSRGTNQWLGFLTTETGITWPAGFWWSTSAVGIIATTSIAALGLAGLTSSRMPQRRVLALCVVIGCLLIGLGYAGSSGSPLAPGVQSLLDGPLAPLRNVHKFDALIRLPIALGIMHGLVRLPVHVQPWVARLFIAPSAQVVRRTTAAVVAVVVAVVGVAAARPALAGELGGRGSFERIEDGWAQTADYLGVHSDRGRALLLPASSFAEYTWGRPLDEPLQALARSNWAVRNAIPLGNPGSTRFLDGINSILEQGRGSTTLAGSLVSAGIGWLVLRNDIDPFTGATAPEVVRATLLGSPGISRDRQFGPRLTTDDAEALGIGPSSPSLGTIEVFRVDDYVPGPRVVPTTDVGSAIGGPEALAIGRLDAGRPWALSSNSSGEPTTVVATDTLRRRAINFGAPVGRAYSPTLPADTDVRRGRPRADVPPEPSGSTQTTLTYAGVDGVDASSSASDPFVNGYVGPQTRPFSAIDGDLDTMWQSVAGDAAPTWRVQLAPRRVQDVTIQLPATSDNPGLSPIRSVTVSTDSASVTRAVGVNDPAQVVRLHLPDTGGATTRQVSVQLSPVDPARPIGLVEVIVPGVSAREVIHVAGDGGDGVSAGRAPGRRRACIKADAAAWSCNPLFPAPGEEIVALDRAFALTDTASMSAVTVSARPGVALDRVLDASYGFVATASSRLVDDPASRPGAAFDSDPSTAWISAAHDPTPRLRVTYGSSVTSTGVTLAATKATLTRIAGVVVATASGRQRVALVGDRLTFGTLTGKAWTLRFILRSVGPVVDRLPLRIAEIDLGGLTDSRAAIDTTCSSGPTLVVDGATRRLRVDADQVDLLSGVDVKASPCDPLTLTAGPHHIRSTDTALWQVESWELRRPRSIATPTASQAVTTLKNEPESRTFVVSAGGARLLIMPEGANPGWSAQIAARQLTPITINGWQQAWEIPASTTSVTVDVVYAPGGWHRAGLAAGLAALACLLGLLIWTWRRDQDDPPTQIQKGPATGSRTRPTVWTGLGVVVLTTLLAGPGGFVVGVVVIAAIRWFPRSWQVVRPVSLGALLAAGVVAALASTPYGSTTTAGLVQLLCVPLLAVVATVGLSTSPSADLSQERALHEEP